MIEIRGSKIRGSEIRGSKIRVSEIRISSNHRELHGAIFWRIGQWNPELEPSFDLEGFTPHKFELRGGVGK